jgi:BirA family transcriptional regulator, biotin operon repressor / biotin---[acetyl-CoA-carboxylase] ligase
MIPADLEGALDRYRDPVRWHESVASTMDVASVWAEEGAGHGCVVGAEEQTAGRGRRGHEWSSPPGAGLYFSFIARPSSSLGLSLLTLAAGVAVQAGIRAATGFEAELKWPNDVMVGRRKLAGILAEGSSIGTSRQFVIIGVGINVLPASYPPEVATRATSLGDELDRAIDRGEVLYQTVSRLHTWLYDAGEKPADVLTNWLQRAPNAHGTRVEWDGGRGVTAGVDLSGALLVETPAGLERIISGEVNWSL